MRKLFYAFMAVVMMCACSNEREYLSFHGLSLGMPAKAMSDSLQEQGFVLDSNLTDEGTYVLNSASELCRVDIIHNNDTITDVLESYSASYNDSTSQLWQRRHDEYQNEFGWPNMNHDSELHREAVYNTGRGGLVLTLLNTYTPTMTVHYSVEELKR